MKLKLLILFSIIFISCKNKKQQVQQDSTSAIDTKNVTFKVLDSRFIDINELWKPFEHYWETFTEEDYLRLRPLILEEDISTLQKYIKEGSLSYEQLTLFYLYRIKKFDRNNDYSLNSVIALNRNVVEEAREKDIQYKNKMMKHPIFGMPILLKDNINASGMPTTAGAIVLADNNTDDAFIVQQLKSNGALILGKTNLSEWAYFFCGKCPSGYSAIGGQTLNPYGRKVIDTGGSSAGSGVASAVNFAVGTVGTETAGSILSPASQNSVVGLKPTVGLLSRSGIVPISGTLDTPGPITRNVADTAILLSAMYGIDINDNLNLDSNLTWVSFLSYFNIIKAPLEGKRFGVFKKLLKDSLYVDAIEVMKESGATIIEIEEVDIELKGFLTLLNIDMRQDLPIYLNKYGDHSLDISSVQDVIVFNKKDSVLVMPYGQTLFYGIVNDKTNDSDFRKIKDSLHLNGKHFFDIHLDTYKLDAILSINNYHAAEAAVAIYPAITVPMGYTKKGEPKGLTFISKSLDEVNLLEWASVYERNSKQRKRPSNYN